MGDLIEQLLLAVHLGLRLRLTDVDLHTVGLQLCLAPIQLGKRRLHGGLAIFDARLLTCLEALQTLEVVHQHFAR
ncbi:MAG TPA: hypothetical protein ENG94_06545 [Actinobacteria bacterium]|nr:hypothetical protein [Actinomycetota bacterium]